MEQLIGQSKKATESAHIGRSVLTPGSGAPRFWPLTMPENMPNAPTGAVPPKKETGKVQPKKETVRITLPPKPSAAPTIKLPTLPPGGPGAAAAKVAATPAAAPAATGAPRLQTSAAPAAAPRATAAPGAAAPRTGTTVPARTAPSAAPASQADVILSIAAAVVGLIAVGSTVYLAFIMK